MLNAFVFITSHIAGLQVKRDERGATAVEYGLLVALIAAVIIATVVILGGQINTAFTEITSRLPGAGGGATT